MNWKTGKKLLNKFRVKLMSKQIESWKRGKFLLFVEFILALNFIASECISICLLLLWLQKLGNVEFL